MNSSKKPKKTRASITKILMTFGLLMFMAGSTQAGGIFSFLTGHYVNGSGDLTTERRELPEFFEIDVSGPFDLVVTCGERQEVTITIDDNLLELISTNVRRGVLKIKCEESFSAHHRSKIEISVERLEAFTLHGSGDVQLRAASEVDELELNLSGSGIISAVDIDVDMLSVGISGSGMINVVDIDVDVFSVSVSGSGKFAAEGKADKVEVRVSGSGDIDLRGLIADDVSVRVSGSGNVEVYAENSFSGRVTGSGDIRIHGNPKQFREKVSGSGDIRRL